MWSALAHVVEHEPSRGVVKGALQALSNLSHLDIGKTMSLTQRILMRYQGQFEPGMQGCYENALTLFCDLSIWRDAAEANAFADVIFSDVAANPDRIRGLIARYSTALLIDDAARYADTASNPRRKTLTFYARSLDQALPHIMSLVQPPGSPQPAIMPPHLQELITKMVEVVTEIAMRLHFEAAGAGNHAGQQVEPSAAQIRLFRESEPLLVRLSDVFVPQVAHHLIQMVEAFISVDPKLVFALIANAVRSSEEAGYGYESMAADLIVRIVERYLADHREIFAEPDRLRDLMDCLDVFVRAGWPAAQSLTFRLGEIWR
jgi:hypothetical protein